MSQKQDEMCPPWQEFPTYERYTIGWRMGCGEQYNLDWQDFLQKKIATDFESRLAYLKRHRPAPLNWANRVYNVLYPNAGRYSKKNFPKLWDLGVFEYDAAYNTWLLGQSTLIWPWQFSDSPEEVARYRTREFWFFSRQLRSLRKSDSVILSKIPNSWQCVATELKTGKLGKFDPQQGLLTLSKMLCAGFVQPPWVLGLSLNDFAESYEMDMGYVDAFQLWITCSFDDNLLLEKILKKTAVPKEWQNWIDEQVDFE